MSSNKRCHDMPSDDLTSIRPWQTNATERWQPQEHQIRTRTSLLSKAIALSNNRGRMTPILVTSGTWVVATRMQNRCVKCQHPAHHMWVVVNDALLAWVVHASVPLATRLEVSDAGPNAGSKEAYSYDWMMSSHDEHDTNKSGTSHHEQNQEQVMNMSGTSHDEKTNVMNMWQIGHRKQNQAINMSGTKSLWTNQEQVMNMSWRSQEKGMNKSSSVIEQFVNKSSTSREFLIEIIMNKSWMSYMNKSRVSHEQVINQSWTNHESNKSWTCHDQIHELSYPMGKSITEQGTRRNMRWFDNQGRNHEQVTSRCSSWGNSSHSRW